MGRLFSGKIWVTAIMLCLCTISVQAQFEAIYIGINGMTCSQCTRTVELSIRKLDFVGDVQMDLQHTEGKIIPRKGAKVNIDKVAQAVYDAGFSVRYLRADFHVDANAAVSGRCITYSGDTYALIDSSHASFTGIVPLTFIGKKYMPKSEFSKIVLPEKACNKGKVYWVKTPGP